MCGMFGFLHVLLNPSTGYLTNTAAVPLAKAVVLMVGFGLVSVGLWAWFRYRPMDRVRAYAAEPAGPARSTPHESDVPPPVPGD